MRACIPDTIAVAAAMVLLQVGCLRGTTIVNDGSDTGSPAGADDTSDTAPRCEPDPGAPTDPKSIDEALQLLNSLPKPTSVTCFVRALERPLRIRATSSTVSLQPAVGPENPRVFVLNDPLIMSIAIKGAGRSLLEFGERVDSKNTLKAEIEFPVSEERTTHEAYRRVALEEESGTKCSTCHSYERPAPDVDPEAYVSRTFRPAPDKLVSLESLRTEWRECDADGTPKRCSMLDALFGPGSVQERPFPDDIPTMTEANE